MDSAGISESDDSELLDLLQARRDASLMDLMDHDARATMARTPPVSQPKPSPLHPCGAVAASAPGTVHEHTMTAFLVGGSLFSARHRPKLLGLQGIASRRALYSTQRTNLRLLDTRGRWATMSALHIGSLYCPFTRQFISLRSPQWYHLQSIGFGLDASVQGGRRMSLVSASKLYRFACQLQGRQPVFSRELPFHSQLPQSAPMGNSAAAPKCLVAVKPDTMADHVAHAHGDGARRCELSGPGPQAAACYADRCWSPLLIATLGKLLESTTVDNFTSFYHSILPALRQDCHPLLARCIELGFQPFHSSTSAHGGAGGATLSGCRETLPWHRVLAQGKTADPLACSRQPSASDLAGCFTDDGRALLDSFGHDFVLSATAWRRHALQCFSKVSPADEALFNATLREREAGERVHMQMELSVRPLSEAAADASQDTEGPASLLDEEARHVERPVPMLSGLPAQVRAAALVLTSVAKTGELWAREMRCALWAVVRELRQRVPPDKAAIYVCPLEHSVDYNSVLDLCAYRVTGGGGDERVSAEVCNGQDSAAVPLLSLGLEHLEDAAASSCSDPQPRRRIVVIANAHLLSRRAVGRLLDQWTRNGAAQRSLDNHQRRQRLPCGGQAAPPPHEAAVIRWRLLLRAEPFTTTTRVRYLRPFGLVQVLFLSQDFAPQTPTRVAAAPLPSQRTIPHPASLFHLEEPLSAALLRCGAVSQAAGQPVPLLSATSRAALLQAVCASALQQLPDSMVLTQAQSKTTLSGKRVFQETAVPLHSSRGQRVLYHACEAVVCAQQREAATAALEKAVGMQPPESAVVPMKSGQCVADALVAFPFLSRIRCRHHLVNSYNLTVTPLQPGQSPCTDGNAPEAPLTALPSVDTPKSAVEFTFVNSARELAEETTSVNDWLLRMARGAVFAHSTRHRCSADSSSLPRRCVRPLLEQHYCSFTEPVVLLGLWTPTLLFCAPAVADVMPLRHRLFEQLRESFRGDGGGEDMRADSDGGAKTEAPFVVVDVDIFHVDFVVFPLDRRCRLFGVRALLQDTSPQHRYDSKGAEASFAAARRCALATAHGRLHELLKLSASDAVFFPLWTYHVLHQHHTALPSPAARTRVPLKNVEPMVGTTTDSRLPPSASELAARRPCQPEAFGDSPPPRSSFQPYRFSSVDEWCSPCPPNLVERRLFACEAAQHPSLRVVVGGHLVLTATVVLAAESHKQGEVTAPTVVPRGTVCRVEAFLPLDAVLSRGDGVCHPTDPVAATIRLDRRVVDDVPYRVMLRRYLEQQREATALPVLRPLHLSSPAAVAAAGSDSSRCFVFALTPQPALVGGYRSVHYYALPVFHLPARALAERPSAGCRTPPRAFFQNKPNLEEATPTEALTAGYPVRQLLHPYHADQDALAFLLLTAQQRGRALAQLVRGGDAGDTSDPAENPFTLVEDLLFSNEATTNRDASSQGGEDCRGCLNGLPAVTAESPSMMPWTPCAEAATDTETRSVLSCGALTALSLFLDLDGP